MRGRWSFQTLYTFKLICFCVIRKPLRAFITIHITNGHTYISKISERRWCIMWILTKFSGLTPVHRPSAAKICTKLTLWNHSTLATFLSLAVKIHVHTVTHGQLRKPQHIEHTYVKHAVRKAHLDELGIQGHSRIQVVLIGAGTDRNRERRVVVMCN